jgi:hypothetical protein
MISALDETIPQAVYHFFDSAHAMVAWLEDSISSPHGSAPALISLDHDLELLKTEDGSVDPGDGRDVAQFLSTVKPFCPVIVHTSNSTAAISMTSTLQDAGWNVSRVYPENDLEWIKTAWIHSAFRQIKTGENK